MTLKMMIMKGVLTNMPSVKSENPRPPKDIKRKCLSCDRIFMSWGHGNRICDPCKQSSLFQGAAIDTHPTHGLRIFKS